MNRETAIAELRAIIEEAIEHDLPKFIAMLSLLGVIHGEQETAEYLAVDCSTFSPEDCRKAIAMLSKTAKTDPESAHIYSEAVSFINTYLLGVSASE